MSLEDFREKIEELQGMSLLYWTWAWNKYFWRCKLKAGAHSGPCFGQLFVYDWKKYSQINRNSKDSSFFSLLMVIMMCPLPTRYLTRFMIWKRKILWLYEWMDQCITKNKQKYLETKKKIYNTQKLLYWNCVESSFFVFYFVRVDFLIFWTLLQKRKKVSSLWDVWKCLLRSRVRPP